VTTDLVSPVFAGRETELAALAGAFEAAASGAQGTVLLGGEAGGGKTRLVREFTARLRDRALVLAGGCVELCAAGLPYAPFTAALRELARQRGAAEVAALLPGEGARELGRLLPEFGTPPADADPELARARMFEVLLALFEQVADERPLVLVVEDLHWADRPTRDLLSFLVRNLRQAAVLLVVTFRSCELQRADPLGPLLTSLERMDGVTRLELSRLSRDEVASQLAGILGRSAEAAAVGAAFARGGGNPLFTEALVNSDGTLSGPLPWSLRDLLIVAVKDLPERTQEVLRTAAVAGARIPHTLLAAVTGSDDTALTAALRPATAANVIVSDADGYAFRHELIREAVLEDLLPGERAQAHRALAEALEADPSLSPERRVLAQLARHWRGAHEDERALNAAWRAAAEATTAFAYAERLHMLELVLELWDQVPDPRRSAATDHIGVLELASSAALWAGETERGLALVEAALAELGEAGDAERRGCLLLQRACLRRDQLLPGQTDDLQAALRLARGPTRVRAHMLTELCWALVRQNHAEEAASLACDLRSLAERLGTEEYQAEATMVLAALAAAEGHDTVDELRRARETAGSSGSAETETRACLLLGLALEARGNHQRAIGAGREGLTRARQLGLGRWMAAPIAGNLAQSLISAGRWDEAQEILQEILSLDLAPWVRAQPLLFRAHIALARGEQDTATRVLQELRAHAAGAPPEPVRKLPLVQLEIECRLAGGDVAGALALAGSVPVYGAGAYPRYLWPLLATAMRACAEAGKATAPPDAVSGELRQALELAAAAAPPLGPVEQAHAAVFAAEASRAAGHPDQPAWDAAVAAWEALGQPYPLAYALLRAAAAALAAGDRDPAATRLRRSADLAAQLAAGPLQQQISQLARRARIELAAPGAGQAAGAPFGLTSRELDVLRLVASGRGNRDIAAELFISPRTASVHVSNILGKLGVTSRGEAAAAAYRLHLVDAP
jgi:ATP/maltotriose-dependent transcriptional regulator MalT